MSCWRTGRRGQLSEGNVDRIFVWKYLFLFPFKIKNIGTNYPGLTSDRLGVFPWIEHAALGVYECARKVGEEQGCRGHFPVGGRYKLLDESYKG